MTAARETSRLSRSLPDTPTCAGSEPRSKTQELRPPNKRRRLVTYP